ncbi:MAG TPA: DPP IV N-terminal domain-containing protein [Pyrinomonadaceae bacterium]|jgi:dipeptidyl-peptidase-4
MTARTFLLIVVLAAAAAVHAPAASAQAQAAKPPLTLEWVYSDEGRRLASVPAHVWLADGKLLLYDASRPAAQRTFEILDPATGARRPALDAAAALASLNALLPAADARPALPWPDSFDTSGRRALYLINGDLYVLDVAAARFARLTKTDAEERDPAFSPDGRRLAFVRTNDLYVLDLDTQTEARVTRDGSETTLNGTLSWVYWEEIFGRRDTGYWWSPDSRAIAYLQTDETPVPVSTFVDFQPETPRVIRQHYPKAGTPNPRVRVGVAELGRDETTWVRITDKPFEYVLRVKWLPDARRLSVQTLTRDQHESGLYFAARDTGAAQRVLTETDPAWVNIHDDLHFLADGKHFLWASERDGYYHLYRYTLDGRLVNQVTSGPWALASSGAGVFWVRQAVTGIDEANGWVYFTAMERAPLERHLYRIKLDGSGLTRLSTEPGVHRISMAPSTQFYLDNFSDVRTLPALALHRADGARQLALAAPRAEVLARFDVQYPELISIPAADGFQMPARVIKPRDFQPARKYPVIIYIYGGPSAPTVANAWQRDVLLDQQLVDAGYVVVRVDNRAATAISKRLENTIAQKAYEPETADLLDAVRWLKAQPWVDGGRVGVWGWSGGGTMTLNLMTRSQEFKAGISVAPGTDWRFYDTKWAEALVGGTPAENPAGYERASLIPRARDLHGRVLIVYGSYDDNVHPQNEQAFIDALIKSGKLFEQMVYPMRKHDIGDRAAQLHLYSTMLDFWKRNL